METNKYIRITNIKELEAAKKENVAKMDEKAREIGEKYIAAKEFYMPENIVYMALKDTTAAVNWIPFALTIIRSLKRKLQ